MLEKRKCSAQTLQPMRRLFFGEHVRGIMEHTVTSYPNSFARRARSVSMLSMHSLPGKHENVVLSVRTSRFHQLHSQNFMVPDEGRKQSKCSYPAALGDS